jgi:hypothetical protein
VGDCASLHSTASSQSSGGPSSNWLYPSGGLCGSAAFVCGTRWWRRDSVNVMKPHFVQAGFRYKKCTKIFGLGSVPTLQTVDTLARSGEQGPRTTGDRLSVLFCFACGFTQGDLRTASRAMPWTSRRLLTSSPPATARPRLLASSRLLRRSEPHRCRSTGAPEGGHWPPDGAQPEPP